MIFDSWQFHLLRIVIEGIAIVALGTALVRARYSIFHIIAAGIGISIIGFFLQKLPIQYGVHIPLSIVLFVLALNMFFKLSMLKSAAATVFSFVVLILIEALIVFVQKKVLGYPEDILEQSTDAEKFLIALPSLVIFCLLAAGVQVWLRLRCRGDVKRSV